MGLDSRWPFSFGSLRAATWREMFHPHLSAMSLLVFSFGPKVFLFFFFFYHKVKWSQGNRVVKAGGRKAALSVSVCKGTQRVLLCTALNAQYFDCPSMQSVVN